MKQKEKNIILSVCLTCNNTTEENSKTQTGQILASNLKDTFKDEQNLTLRGVNCMSNCKRSCIISLTAENCFTYVFGDVDPKNHEYINSLKELIISYNKSPEGFLRRRHRPEIYRSNIVGRFPPINSKSELITSFEKELNKK